MDGILFRQIVDSQTPNVRTAKINPMFSPHYGGLWNVDRPCIADPQLPRLRITSVERSHGSVVGVGSACVILT